MRSRMYRFWPVYLLLCLLLATGYFGVCESAAPVRVTGTAEPNQMVSAETTHVHLSVTNDGATSVKVCRLNGEVLYDAGDEAKFLFSEDIEVTEKDLDNGGISYVIQYTRDGERRTVPVLVPLERVSVSPALELTRAVSSSVVDVGDEVHITYRLKNAGNVPLTDVRVDDELVGEVARIDELQAGEKVTYVVPVTVRENCVSEPRAKAYCRANGREYTEKAEPLTITLYMGTLETKLEAQRTEDGHITLRLRMTNQSNAVISNIKISEATLGDFGVLAGELEPGDSAVFTRTIEETNIKVYQCSVSASRVPMDSVNVVSNPVQIEAIEKKTDTDISLQATDENGAFLCLINRGKTLYNVEISSEDGNTVKTLSVVPEGETKIRLPEGKGGIYSASFTDDTGGTMTVFSEKVESVSAAETENTVWLPENTETPVTPTEDTVYPKMMYGIVLVLMALIGVFVWGAVHKAQEAYAQKVLQMRRVRATSRREKREAEQQEQEKQRADDVKTYEKIPKTESGERKNV